MPAIRLDKISTRAPKGMNKDKTKQRTGELLDELNEMQNQLYAESKHSVLIILQALDAGGKDGLVRNIFGKFNPQGVLVQSFKVPSAEELAHDFLWRIHKHTPAKGYIQVFNRSQYEDVLVTRVHKIIDDETAMERMQAINNFEKLLLQNNTHILKFYLHISPDEQKKRLDERIQDPRKQWKYNENDFTERKLWKEYMAAYQDMFKHCNEVPWTILPSDQNWYKEYIAAGALHTLLKSLNMQYPGIKK